MAKRFVKQSGFIGEYTQKQNKKIEQLQAENERLREKLELAVNKCEVCEWNPKPKYTKA